MIIDIELRLERLFKFFLLPSLIEAIIGESHEVSHVNWVYFSLLVNIKAVLSLAILIDFVLNLDGVSHIIFDFTGVVHDEFSLIKSLQSEETCRPLVKEWFGRVNWRLDRSLSFSILTRYYILKVVIILGWIVSF